MVNMNKKLPDNQSRKTIKLKRPKTVETIQDVIADLTWRQENNRGRLPLDGKPPLIIITGLLKAWEQGLNDFQASFETGISPQTIGLMLKIYPALLEKKDIQAGCPNAKAKKKLYNEGLDDPKTALDYLKATDESFNSKNKNESDLTKTLRDTLIADLEQRNAAIKELTKNVHTKK